MQYLINILFKFKISELNVKLIDKYLIYMPRYLIRLYIIFKGLLVNYLVHPAKYIINGG